MQDGLHIIFNFLDFFLHDFVKIDHGIPPFLHFQGVFRRAYRVDPMEYTPLGCGVCFFTFRYCPLTVTGTTMLMEESVLLVMVISASPAETPFTTPFSTVAVPSALVE